MTRRGRSVGTVARRALALLVLVAAPTGAAAAAGASVSSTVFAEPFTTSSVTAPVVLPGVTTPKAKNVACLTASSATTATPIPGCEKPAIDKSGDGALRLTTSLADKEGGVFSTTSVPTVAGLDVTFDSYQYDGTGGDGIAFVLAAANPADPSSPPDIGAFAGALGYANFASIDSGLSDGYLGIGLDVFGGFGNPDYGGTDCGTAPTWASIDGVPEQVTVRGPGDGSDGYCLLASSASGDSGEPLTLDDEAATTRSAAEVPVEVLVNPSGETVTSNSGSGLTAAPHSYAVSVGTLTPAVTFRGRSAGAVAPATGATVVTGTLPDAANDPLLKSLYPSSWLNPKTGIPEQLSFGWVAATGVNDEIHEVSDVTVRTITALAPVLSVGSITTYATAAASHTKLVTWTIPVALPAGSPSESKPITAVVTLPAGTKVVAAGGGAATTAAAKTGSYWSCGRETSDDTLSCATVGGPFSSKHPPPLLVVTGRVPATSSKSSSSSDSVSVKVSSPDGVPGLGRTNISGKAPPPPSHLAVTPSLGPTAGGNSVLITGDHLAGTTSVAIGTSIAQPCPAPADTACFTESSKGVEVHDLAPGDPGSVTVVVTTLGEIGSAAYRFSEGYWVVADDGGVFTFGTAAFHGSLGHETVVSPVIGIAPAALQSGYWLARANGSVYAFGHAANLGSVAKSALKGHIVGIASDAAGTGYWLASSTGEVYAFGSAPSLEAKGATDIVAIAADPAGPGFFLVSATGTVYAAGAVRSHGSVAGSALKGHVVGLASTPTGSGYWVATSGGQVFHFGTAAALGPSPTTHLASPPIAIAATPDGKGIWLALSSGLVQVGYGDATVFPPPPQHTLRGPVVGITDS